MINFRSFSVISYFTNFFLIFLVGQQVRNWLERQFIPSSKKHIVLIF